MDLWLIPLLVIIVSLVLAVTIDIRSGRLTIGRRDDVPSPMVRILEMGPQCAEAVGVYKLRSDKKGLEKRDE